MNYLLKTEPTEYSFADLRSDQTTNWDGVSNPVALKHLREMKPGDRLIIYETGDHKSAVGTASVVTVDPVDPHNPAVKIKAGKPLAKPVSLAEIKADKLLPTRRWSARAGSRSCRCPTRNTRSSPANNTGGCVKPPLP